MERSMKRRNVPGPQGKRGRKPKRCIRTKEGLVAEVKAEIAAIDPEHKLKKPPVEQAIANCLRRDATTQPRSWWWKDDAPLGLNSATALYYKAAADLEKHGPLEPFLPLSELGKRCGIEQPTPTLDGVIEQMLGDKQWLNEQKQTMSPAMFQAYNRDLHRERLGLIAFLKRTANDIRIKLAADAPLHSAEKVQRVRDVLVSLEAQIADF
jgi:hypothetical protein